MNAQLLVACLAVAVSGAEESTESIDWSLSLSAGADARPSPELSWHGFFIADLKAKNIGGGATGHLQLNTDTLYAGIEGLQLAPQLLELDGWVRGEALFAGLLPDYFKKGERDPTRGFWASYLQLGAALKWLIIGHHSLRLEQQTTWWWLTAASETSVPLPRDPFIYTSALRYTYWNIDAPGEEFAPHRLFPRLRGVAASGALVVEGRDKSGRWGQINDTEASGGRNHPAAWSWRVETWVKAAWPVRSWLTLGLNQEIFWGTGLDDLNRRRVGGLNPWVLPMGGQAWASIISDRLISLAPYVAWRFFEHQITIGWQGAWVNDIYRNGNRDGFSFVQGISAAVDLRFGPWQIDMVLGYSLPHRSVTRQPHLNVLLAVGRQVF